MQRGVLKCIFTTPGLVVHCHLRGNKRNRLKIVTHEFGVGFYGGNVAFCKWTQHNVLNVLNSEKCLLALIYKQGGPPCHSDGNILS